MTRLPSVGRLQPFETKDDRRSAVGEGSDAGGDDGSGVPKMEANHEVCGELATGEVETDSGVCVPTSGGWERDEPRARRFPSARHAAEEQ
jgi:hypothetical protein